MKIIFLLGSSLLLLKPYITQSPNLLWIENGVCINDDQIESTIFDNEGNVLAGGYFSGNLSLGGFDLSSTGGSQDFFLTKYSPQGDCLWAISGGGTGHDQINCIAVDANNNIIISGSFQSTTLILNNDTLRNNGSWDTFFASADQLGNFNWAKQLNCSGHDNPTSISTDNNSILIAGRFYNDLVIENDTLYNSSLSKSDGFLIKLNDTGNLIWIKKIGGADNDVIEDIVIDSLSNTYVTGTFGNADLQLDSITLINRPGGEVFIAKYNPNGVIEWAKSAGAQSLGCYSYTIDVDQNNNPVIGGYFLGYSMEVENYVLSNAGGYLIDPFLIKYHHNGSLEWANSYGTTAGETFYNLRIDKESNIYASGSFDIWNSDLLPTIFGDDTLFGYKDWDLLMVKLDSIGNPIWAIEGGGMSTEEFNTQTLDLNETNRTLLFGSGYYSDTLAVDSSEIYNSGLSGTNSLELFFGLLQEDQLDVASSILEKPETIEINLRPNPTNGEFFISSDTPIINIEIIDVFGKRVNFIFNQTDFNIELLPNGVYFVRILTSNEQTITKRIIKY